MTNHKLTLLVLGLTTVCLACRAGEAAKNPPTRKAQTYYFMDWTAVEKGRLDAVYDASRLTEESKTNFANLKKEWGIETKMGRHGTHSYHVAKGVRFTLEL